MSGFVPNVSYDQMKAAIGSLILLWSTIERSLAEATWQLDPVVPPEHGISRSIDLWSRLLLCKLADRPRHADLGQRLAATLKDALTVRNLICHGLVGGAGQFHESDPEAYLTVELGQVRRTLTLSELSAMLHILSVATHLIENLTCAAMVPDTLGSNDWLVDWEDFPRQRKSSR